MDYEGVKARVAAFEARHGEAIQEPGGGFILFADGAARDPNPIGVLLEPPRDPAERARRIARFHELRLLTATARFTEKKNVLLSECRSSERERFTGPPSISPEEAETLLLALKETVDKCKAAYDAARAEVERLKPQSLRAKEQQSAVNRAAKAELHGRISRIEV